MPPESAVLKRGYPIDDVIERLCQKSINSDIILMAPPGAGKSTCVPLALMAMFPKKRILMLQPRRVVVKHLAAYLASELGENIGQSVGYRMRGESRVSDNTQLTIVTEGVLTRLIQNDPDLSQFDFILFDEFHERNVHADIGLALVLESQQALREDLRIIVMSATLDQEALQTLLPNAEQITSHGRMFDVGITYCGDCKNAEVVERTVSAVNAALAGHLAGDILVFLPSARLIHQCARKLARNDISVVPLYGALSVQEQSNALQQDSGGRRKVVLSTNIAETSLTIEGVTIVVDSGRVQQARFDVETATVSLNTKMISQPSSIQRMGRAGRTAPGHCYRLWSASTQERLQRTVRPAIKEVDILPHQLDIMMWGTQFSDLAMLDQPDKSQLDYAFTALQNLEAVSEQGQLTPLGKKLAHSDFSPPIAAMLIVANEGSQGDKMNAAIAATLMECANSIGDDDVEKAIRNQLHKPGLAWKAALRNALKAVNLLSTSDLTSFELKQVAAWVARALPQRVAFRVAATEWKMASGPRFTNSSLAQKDDWCVVLSGQKTEIQAMKVFTVLAVDFASLQQRLSTQFSSRQSLTFDKQKAQFIAREQKCFAEIVYANQPVSNQREIDWARAWVNALQQGELGLPPNVLPLNQEGKNWLARLSLLARYDKQSAAYQQVDHAYLLKHAEEWLLDALNRCRTLKQVEALPWPQLLNQLLPWDRQQRLQTLVPTQIKVGNGQMRALDYTSQDANSADQDAQVVLSVKLQEMFGINAPITICNGRVTVTLSLLSPAGRPLQMTKDLQRFWQGSYHEVAKEMRGRYPKHPWPDDPASAQATSFTKKKQIGKKTD